MMKRSVGREVNFMSRGQLMELFGIGEIARRAGVATSTIRYYERIGLLPKCQQVSGKRRYDTSIFHKLALIRMAQGAGLTIAEIQTLMHGFPADAPPSERWQTLAPRKIQEVDALINQAMAMKKFWNSR
jgi:MerR family redox-sensitive transcriptional activator SoxR